MGKGRFEAFSDGVLAIIITIMVLELKVPHGEDLESLRPVLPVFLSYVLSFVNIGIYWNNHHHMLHTVRHVTGGMLWANLHLLFWLSLLPFTTAWLGENHLAAAPMSLYGLVLLMSGAAYKILQEVIIRSQGEDSLLQKATGRDVKGLIPFGLYATGVVIAWWIPPLALALYILVALLWLVPDRRIERAIAESERENAQIQQRRRS